MIYDRANSCVTQMTPEQIDWPHLLITRLLHLTGITPALSTGCQAIIQEIARTQTVDVPISFDVNYRRKLWTPCEAAETLLQGVELLFCPQGDPDRLFGLNGTPEDIILQLANKTRAKTIVVSMGSDAFRCRGCAGGRRLARKGGA